MDVSEKSYGYNNIATVIDEGIFKGSNGYFHPDKTLTRAEMAAIINRSFLLEKKIAEVSFTDISSSHWAYQDIQALAANQITTGYEDNSFKPNQTITRAEFTVFMARVLKNTDGENFEVIGIY